MRRTALPFGLAALVRALTLRAGRKPAVEDIRSRPWASITFTGMRHRFVLRFDGDGAAPAVARLSDRLDYAEFDLGRHILVDIAMVDRAVDTAGARLTLEALILAGD